ncbi:MAG: hypothetical protein ACLR5J_03315 [Lachnospiraceae bacterium]
MDKSEIEVYSSFDAIEEVLSAGCFCGTLWQPTTTAQITVKKIAAVFICLFIHIPSFLY